MHIDIRMSLNAAAPTVKEANVLMRHSLTWSKTDCKP